MSVLDLQGRGRADVVRGVELDVERRDESVDVKAREVDEDSSLGVVFGRWWGYSFGSIVMFGLCGMRIVKQPKRCCKKMQRDCGV